MATKLYDLVVTTGEYYENGKKKRANRRIGSIWEYEKNGETRQYMLLDTSFNFAILERTPTSTDVFVSMFKPKPKDQDSQSQGQQFQSQAPIDPEPYNPDEKIPF